MSTTTQYFDLVKPAADELFSLQTMNDNLDAIDAAMAGMSARDTSAPLYIDENSKLSVRTDGQSIAVNENGAMYATGTVSPETVPVATANAVGAVKPDNSTLRVSDDGTLYVDTEQVGGGSGGIDSGSVNSPLYVDSGVLGLDTSQLAQSLAGTGLTSDPSTGVMSLDEHSLYSTLESNSNGTLESGSGIQVKLDSSGGLTNTGNGIGIDLSSLLMMSGFLSYSGGLTNDGNGLAIQLGSSNCLVNNGSGLDIDLQALAQALQPYLS